jgi:hypothetical protein
MAKLDQIQAGLVNTRRPGFGTQSLPGSAAGQPAGALGRQRRGLAASESLAKNAGWSED